MSDSAHSSGLIHSVRSTFTNPGSVSPPAPSEGATPVGSAVTPVSSDQVNASSQPVVTPAVSAMAAPPTSTLDEALAIADQVLSEVEANALTTPSAFVPSNPQTTAPVEPSTEPSVLPQVVPTVVQSATDTLNPAYAGSTAKEALEGATSPDTQAVDAGAAIQYVEYEPNPEIPVEVESFIQKIDDHQDQLPTEIVIADTVMPVPQPNFPTHKVVVLPITPEVEAAGEKKNTSWSVRWLVEWSQKIMKMFTGDVIYRQSE